MYRRKRPCKGRFGSVVSKSSLQKSKLRIAECLNNWEIIENKESRGNYTSPTYVSTNDPMVNELRQLKEKLGAMTSSIYEMWMEVTSTNTVISKALKRICEDPVSEEELEPKIARIETTRRKRIIKEKDSKKKIPETMKKLREQLEEVRGIARERFYTHKLLFPDYGETSTSSYKAPAEEFEEPPARKRRIMTLSMLEENRTTPSIQTPTQQHIFKPHNDNLSTPSPITKQDTPKPKPAQVPKPPSKISSARGPITQVQQFTPKPKPFPHANLNESTPRAKPLGQRRPGRPFPPRPGTEWRSSTPVPTTAPPLSKPQPKPFTFNEPINKPIHIVEEEPKLIEKAVAVPKPQETKPENKITSNEKAPISDKHIISPSSDIAESIKPEPPKETEVIETEPELPFLVTSLPPTAFIGDEDYVQPLSHEPPPQKPSHLVLGKRVRASRHQAPKKEEEKVEPIVLDSLPTVTTLDENTQISAEEVKVEEHIPPKTDNIVVDIVNVNVPVNVEEEYDFDIQQLYDNDTPKVNVQSTAHKSPERNKFREEIKEVESPRRSPALVRSSPELVDMEMEEIIVNEEEEVKIVTEVRNSPDFGDRETPVQLITTSPQNSPKEIPSKSSPEINKPRTPTPTLVTQTESQVSSPIKSPVLSSPTVDIQHTDKIEILEHSPPPVEIAHVEEIIIEEEPSSVESKVENTTTVTEITDDTPKESTVKDSAQEVLPPSEPTQVDNTLEIFEVDELAIESDDDYVECGQCKVGELLEMALFTLEKDSSQLWNLKALSNSSKGKRNVLYSLTFTPQNGQLLGDTFTMTVNTSNYSKVRFHFVDKATCDSFVEFWKSRGLFTAPEDRENVIILIDNEEIPVSSSTSPDLVPDSNIVPKIANETDLGSSDISLTNVPHIIPIEIDSPNQPKGQHHIPDHTHIPMDLDKEPLECPPLDSTLETIPEPPAHNLDIPISEVEPTELQGNSSPVPVPVNDKSPSHKNSPLPSPPSTPSPTFMSDFRSPKSQPDEPKPTSSLQDSEITEKRTFVEMSQNITAFFSETPQIPEDDNTDAAPTSSVDNLLNGTDLPSSPFISVPIRNTSPNRDNNEIGDLDSILARNEINQSNTSPRNSTPTPPTPGPQTSTSVEASSQDAMWFPNIAVPPSPSPILNLNSDQTDIATTMCDRNAPDFIALDISKPSNISLKDLSTMELDDEEPAVIPRPRAESRSPSPLQASTQNERASTPIPMILDDKVEESKTPVPTFIDEEAIVNDEGLVNVDDLWILDTKPSKVTRTPSPPPANSENRPESSLEVDFSGLESPFPSETVKITVDTPDNDYFSDFPTTQIPSTFHIDNNEHTKGLRKETVAEFISISPLTVDDNNNNTNVTITNTDKPYNPESTESPTYKGTRDSPFDCDGDDDDVQIQQESPPKDKSNKTYPLPDTRRVLAPKDHEPIIQRTSGHQGCLPLSNLATAFGPTVPAPSFTPPIFNPAPSQLAGVTFQDKGWSMPPFVETSPPVAVEDNIQFSMDVRPLVDSSVDPASPEPPTPTSSQINQQLDSDIVPYDPEGSPQKILPDEEVAMTTAEIPEGDAPYRPDATPSPIPVPNPTTDANPGETLQSESMPLFILLVGIPGSGKSTWASQFKEKAGDKVVIVCPDQIRKELTGSFDDLSSEEEVWQLAQQRCIHALNSDKITILDTFAIREMRRAFVANLPPCHLAAKVFNVEVEVARARLKRDLEAGVERPTHTIHELEALEESLTGSPSALIEEGFNIIPNDDE